jgi:hypothetical protein
VENIVDILPAEFIDHISTFDHSHIALNNEEEKRIGRNKIMKSTSKQEK